MLFGAVAALAHSVAEKARVRAQARYEDIAPCAQLAQLQRCRVHPTSNLYKKPYPLALPCLYSSWICSVAAALLPLLFICSTLDPKKYSSESLIGT